MRLSTLPTACSRRPALGHARTPRAHGMEAHPPWSPTLQGSFHPHLFRSPGTRLDWYKNIPVPTSYMICNTDKDFFGGYDHGARGGVVHVASHHIAPGKKQWTWGNHEFGWVRRWGQHEFG